MYNFFCKYIKEAGFKIFLLSVLGMGSSACGIYMAFASKNVVDAATLQTGASLINEGLKLLVALVLLLLFQSGVSALHAKTSADIKKSLQKRLFKTLLLNDRLKIASFHSGELVNRLAGDVGIVAEGAAEIIPAALSLALRVILGFAAIAVLDLPLAFICIALGPLMLLGARLYRKKSSRLFLKSRETEGEVRSFLQEAIQNISVIKAFSAYDCIINQFSGKQNKAYKLSLLKNAVSILVNVCFFTMMTAGYYAALGWCAWRIKTGVMSFGTMTALLGLTGEVTSPFRSIASLFAQSLSVRASVLRLSELEGKEEEQCAEERVPFSSISAIALQNVSFSYGAGSVLKNACAEFKTSALTGLCGDSGAGKSTVLNLLAGLLKPKGGKIVLKTQAGEEKELNNAYLSLFAYVPQDMLVLSGTIKENITFFAEEVNEERLKKAVELSCLEEFVLSMPNGLNTLLGENGSNLSGGQRQRVAIARALYSNAEILLLDEATSALSEETERAVLLGIKNAGYTAIVVTHRTGVLNMCNNCLKIDGSIIEEKFREEK